MKNIVRCLVSIAALGSVLSLTSSAFADEAPEAEAVVTAAAAETKAPATEEAAPVVAPETTPEETVTERTVVASSSPAPAPSTAADTFTFSPYAAPNADRVDAPATSSKEKFRVGALAGVGFPRPFAIEAFAKAHKVVGFGVEYSFLPKVNMFGADTTFGAVAADLRVFPFKNGLFVGLRGGHQWLDTRMTVSAGRFGSSRETMSASTWFVNPRIGVLHTFSSGVTLGIDAGIQVPISPSYSRTGALAGNEFAKDTDKTLVGIANALGNKTTPTIDILRVGFMF